MKAITAVCPTGAAVVNNGRVARRNQASSNNNNNNSNNNGENAEIKMYLSKLKDLVPFMPKNRKLSKLEIIQHVIDYICDLQSELETSPAVSNFDAAAVLHELQQDDRIITDNHHQINNINNNNHNNSIISSSLPVGITNNSSHHQHRQPLVDRSTPNMILTSTPPQSAVINPSVVHYQHQNYSHTATDKINFDGNSRL